jgi:hypothetical protein
LAAASLLSLLPDWAIPALAQDDTLVPFTDLPANFNPTPTAVATTGSGPGQRGSVARLCRRRSHGRQRS